MDLSERHARRLLGAYREVGPEALAHGNRDRRPHNAVPEAVAPAVARLAATRYPGANHTHLTELLERFLPRFNARFAVAARQREPAWRPLDSTLDLGAILAFRHTRTVARDNTVKYHWRTLQLLPSPQRTSYAGARVEVLERPGGELAVRHQGETIPSRLAPPRSGVLRERRSELALDPALERIASGLGPSGGPPRPQAHPATTNGTIVNAAAPTVLRSPTARQAARWKAIQQALLQGLSMRATARLLGISRNTIRRYVRADGPPGRQDAASSTSSDHPGGHVR